jgi:acyl-CoA thioesterase II
VRIQDIDFRELLELVPHGPDTFVGITASYPWGARLYGGQVVAQALRAAAMTVPVDRPAHSLHAYFIRPGTRDEPVRYEVERLRDGRSFTTRQVVARQSTGAILNLSVSFHTAEHEADVPGAVLPEDAPSPDDPSLLDHGWGRLLDRRATPLRAPGFEHGRTGHWIRLLADVGDDAVLQACALAFISDAAPSRAARAAHPDATGSVEDRRRFQGASLDHAIWFHRPSRAEAWHWFDTRTHGLYGGRGVVTGDVVTADGTHVATMAQQVLLRRLPDAAPDGAAPGDASQTAANGAE